MDPLSNQLRGSLYPNRPELRTNLIGASALTKPSINRLGLSDEEIKKQLLADAERRKGMPGGALIAALGPLALSGMVPGLPSLF